MYYIVMLFCLCVWIKVHLILTNVFLDLICFALNNKQQQHFVIFYIQLIFIRLEYEKRENLFYLSLSVVCISIKRLFYRIQYNIAIYMVHDNVKTVKECMSRSTLKVCWFWWKIQTTAIWVEQKTRKKYSSVNTKQQIYPRHCSVLRVLCRCLYL